MGGGRKSFRSLLFVGAMSLPAFGAIGDGQVVTVPGLEEDDFRQIGEQGFGDSANSYAWGMAYFKGKLYVGTNRNFLCMTAGRSSTGFFGNPEIPLTCAPDLLDMDLRARIYAYDPAADIVEEVWRSPTFSTLLSDGTRVDVPRAVGYRTIVGFVEKDGTEAMYVGSFVATSLPSNGAEILRSVDGRRFEPVSVDVPAGVRFSSFRSLTVYNGRLIVIGNSPDPLAPGLLELDESNGRAFRGIADGSLDDPVNAGAFELAVFAGYLYVGTTAAQEGFQLLKSQLSGPPPYTFEKVLVDGAYRGIKSQSVVSLTPFKDHLYLGTGVYFGSRGLVPGFRPSPAELLRVKADDTWEIICGDERTTPDGYKAPITGKPAGFGNYLTGYFWRMIEHDGVLYVGTFDNSVLAQFSSDIKIDELQEGVAIPPHLAFLAPLVDYFGPEEIADVISAVEGGFDLWRTADGVQYYPVSITGFHDSFSYGVRNLESTPYGLFLGTANPFLGMRVFLGQPPGTDTDGDSFPDAADNCPGFWNLSQSDRDGDGIGNACDQDADGDCILDTAFNVTAGLSESEDLDNDDLLNGCDDDDDGDGVLDGQDNCLTVSNFDQSDADGDGIGDACAPTPTASVPLPLDAETQQQAQDLPAKITLPGACGATASLLFWLPVVGLFGLRAKRRR